MRTGLRTLAKGILLVPLVVGFVVGLIVSPLLYGILAGYSFAERWLEE